MKKYHESLCNLETVIYEFCANRGYFKSWKKATEACEKQYPNQLLFRKGIWNGNFVFGVIGAKPVRTLIRTRKKKV